MATAGVNINNIGIKITPLLSRTVITNNVLIPDLTLGERSCNNSGYECCGRKEGRCHEWLLGVDGHLTRVGPVHLYVVASLLRDSFSPLSSLSSWLNKYNYPGNTPPTACPGLEIPDRRNNGRSITAQVGRGRCDHRSRLCIAIFSRGLRSLPSQLWVVTPSLFINEWKEPPG